MDAFHGRNEKVLSPAMSGTDVYRCLLHQLFILASVIILAILPACSRKTPGSEKREVVHNQRLRSQVKTLDAGDIGDTASSAVGEEFYECLYGYHYLKRPHQIIPELAAQMPHVSDDGLVYRIPIRCDVHFHDDPCFPESKGRILKAEDFVFAWKRIANVKVRSRNWWIFNGRIVGLDDFREYSKTCKKGEVDYSKPVEGLYAEDDFTLVIKLKQPWPQLIYWLAHLPTAPMAKEAVDHYGPDIVRHPVGTGAFMLKKWHRGVYIEAIRNPKYHHMRYPTEGMAEDVVAGLLEDADKPIPFIDRVIWRVINEDQPRWLLLMRGEIDLITIPKDNFGQAVSLNQDLTPEMQRRGVVLELFDEPCTFYLSYNLEDPVLKNNKPLRYAINYAINREKYIDLILSSKGKASLGYTPLAMGDYDPTITEWTEAVYDVEKAKAAMKKAVKVHGGPIPKLRLASRTGTAPRQGASLLARSLNEIGLEIELEFFDWPTFLERMKNAQHQMFFSGWLADYPDVENFMQVYYTPNAPWPNSSNYSNPEFDAIYEKVSLMADSPERRKLYDKAQKIVLEDMPCAFTYHRIGYIIRHRWLGNLKPDPYKPDTAGAGYIKYYKIDKEKRDQYRRDFK